MGGAGGAVSAGNATEMNSSDISGTMRCVRMMLCPPPRVDLGGHDKARTMKRVTKNQRFLRECMDG